MSAILILSQPLSALQTPQNTEEMTVDKVKSGLKASYY